MNKKLRDLLQKIRLLVLDVDGVLTDGKIYYDSSGNKFKSFDIKDGLGLVYINKFLSNELKIAIVSIDDSRIILHRAKDLGIDIVRIGINDKFQEVKKICESLKISLDEACFIGDDLTDIEIMKKVGLAVAVGDAVKELQRYAHYITKAKGGNGAVREVCNLFFNLYKTF